MAVTQPKLTIQISLNFTYKKGVCNLLESINLAMHLWLNTHLNALAVVPVYSTF